MHHAHHAGADGALAPAVLFALLVAVPLCVLAAYLAGAARVRGQGAASGGYPGAWPVRRTVAFAAGVALILLAMAPPLAGWAHRDLRGHMVQHLLLGMFAPLALALGAPGTLLLRRLRPARARRLVRWLDVMPVRVLIHPASAALFDIGGMALLYLTPLFALSRQSPSLHVLLHLHFVISGYLFSWAIAGPDPAPHRPGMRTRLAVLFLASAAHGMLAKLMYGYGFPDGAGAGPAELQAAALWMYYGGDLAELLLAAALFAAWFRRPRTLPRAVAGIDAVSARLGLR